MRTLSLVALLSTLAAAQDKVDFKKQVWPILEARCLSCHGPELQEGDMRIDQRDSVLGEKSLRVVAGDPAKSILYKRITLARDHADVMPAEGEPLKAEQIELVKRWIAEGAAWSDVAAAAPARPAEPAIEVPEPSAEERATQARAMQALTGLGGVAMRIAADSHAVYVNLGLPGPKVGDAQLGHLDGLESTLVWLNLARTAVTDAGLSRLARFRELRRLHLEGTKVGDAALEHLAGLDKLEYLNLYGTAVTDAGLAKLAGLAGLRRLYLWQTKTTAGAAAKLQQAIPGLKIDRGEHVAVIEKVAAELAAKAPVNAVCPVTGKPVVATATTQHAGQTIAFCCQDCLGKFTRQPAAFAGKIQRTAAPAAKQPVNATCPLTGQPVKPEHALEFEGRWVGFCCGDCLAKVQEDPATFADKLRAAK